MFLFWRLEENDIFITFKLFNLPFSVFIHLMRELKGSQVKALAFWSRATKMFLTWHECLRCVSAELLCVNLKQKSVPDFSFFSSLWFASFLCSQSTISFKVFENKVICFIFSPMHACTSKALSKSLNIIDLWKNPGRALSINLLGRTGRG